MSIKRCVAALAGVFALGWSGMAFAQVSATPGPTPIPTCASLADFVCAYSAAETISLVTPKTVASPGQPDVYLGYLAFDSTGTNVTLTGTSNVNGTVTQNISLPGTCVDPTAFLQPAILKFPGTGKTTTQLSFVKNAANTELQFILTQDINSTSGTSANNIRIGVCRQ